MELNKKNVKKILLIASFCIALFLALSNITVVWSAVKKIGSFFTPFVLGGFIALISNVLLVPVEYRLFSKSNSKISQRLRRPVSLLMSSLIVVLLIVLIVFIVAPEIKKTVELIIENFPSWWDKAYAAVISFLDKYDISAQRLRELNIDWTKIYSHLESFIKDGSSNILNTTVNITASIFTSIFNFVLGIIFSYYALAQKEKLAVQAKKILYAVFDEKKVQSILEVGEVSSRVFSNFIRGQVTEAFVIAILCCIGMLIFRMPYAFMISVLIGVTALIPVFGAFIGTAVGALLIVMVDPMKAFWFIVFIVILQQLEGNLIYPKVVGSSVGLPGIWVLVAATVGASAGGILGLFLAIPISAAAYCLIARYVSRRLEAKGIDSSRWQLEKNIPQPGRISKVVKAVKEKIRQNKETKTTKGENK
ncbi:MAG: AI-2E family transporter [Clostridia bacterium]|nr:AI-2E family transporter [Clostridia bacterium]